MSERKRERIDLGPPTQNETHTHIQPTWERETALSRKKGKVFCKTQQKKCFETLKQHILPGDQKDIEKNGGFIACAQALFHALHDLALGCVFKVLCD